MPFQHRMIVTIEGSQPDPNLYYEVNHIAFPAGTEVQTFDENLSGAERLLLQQVATLWNNPPIGRLSNEYTVTVPASGSCELRRCRQEQIFHVGGTGQFNALALKVGADNPNLRALAYIFSLTDTKSLTSKRPSPIFAEIRFNIQERPFDETERNRLPNSADSCHRTRIPIHIRNGQKPTSSATLHAACSQQWEKIAKRFIS